MSCDCRDFEIGRFNKGLLFIMVQNAIVKKNSVQSVISVTASSIHIMNMDIQWTSN